MNNVDFEKKINNMFTLLVIIVIVCVFNSILIIVSLSKGNVSSNKGTTTQTSETSDYDVSSFKALDIGGVLDLFDQKETSVLYLGRASCSACVSFLPTLKAVQSEYNFVTNYLDITTVSSSSEDFKTFLDKLTKKIKVTANGETSEGPISDYYGYTPMVIIIKNGKAVDASVGAYTQTKFETFLNDNGIK